MRITPISILEVRESEKKPMNNETRTEPRQEPRPRPSIKDKPICRLFPDWIDILSYFDGDSFKTAVLAIVAKYNGEQPDLEKLKPDEQAVMRLILSQIDRYSNQMATGRKSQPYNAEERRV